MALMETLTASEEKNVRPQSDPLVAAAAATALDVLVFQLDLTGGLHTAFKKMLHFALEETAGLGKKKCTF